MVDRTDGSALPAYFGRYVLLKALGRGAMGDVHLARPINRRRGLPSLVVLKRLHDELAAKEAFVSRFRHEAAVAVSVDSQHVAKAYDIGAVGSALYIVMEHVDGWPVSRVVDAVVKSGHRSSDRGRKRSKHDGPI
ncbi:MAG: protein kinase, partial [Myxococcota bacterium]